MGYTVNGGGTVKVRADQEAEAVAKLQAWARDAKGGHVGYAASNQLSEIMAAETVAEVFATFGGMEVSASDEPGAFDLWHGDSWSEDYDEAAALISPYVEPGTVEWTGEDDSHWRWRFTGSELIEDSGAVTYDADPGRALDEIATALRGADWSGVMYDDDVLYEIHAIITGTGRDAGPR